jgi:oligoribonuclease (3'-5' exoribonuclease)
MISDFTKQVHKMSKLFNYVTSATAMTEQQMVWEYLYTYNENNEQKMIGNEVIDDL